MRGAVTLPGSKSLTNRALVLAALSTGPSTISGALRSRDTDLMAAALRALGADIDATGDGWRVSPAPWQAPAHVDCGLAGTVMRFIPPVAALAPGPVTFDGDLAARDRPMATLLGALRALGISVDAPTGDSLPFTLTGSGRVRGGTVDIDTGGSSQFVSGLLLAGARYDAGVEVVHSGGHVPSRPHIAMTVDQLRQRNVVVEQPEANRWRVRPGAVTPVDVDIEPDLSNAGPFLAAALVTDGQVTVPGWPSNTTQAGDAWREILTRMGATTTLTDAGLTVAGGGGVTGVDLDLGDTGELTPVVAALCAHAATPSRLRGIRHLRGHETDRLAALAAELNALDGCVTETVDGLRIEPTTLRPGRFHTYADHRMAHAGVVLGLTVAGLEIEDIGTTDKTYPGFAASWSALVAGGAG